MRIFGRISVTSITQVRVNRGKESDEEYVQRTLNPEGADYPTTQEALNNGTQKGEILDYFTVVKVLPEDHVGIQHQLFYARSRDGVLVKVAHNIDVAPRIPDLKPGLKLAIKGELINLSMYSSEIPDEDIDILSKLITREDLGEVKAVLHWTHHDPAGQHIDGGIVILTPGPHYREVIS